MTVKSEKIDTFLIGILQLSFKILGYWTAFFDVQSFVKLLLSSAHCFFFFFFFFFWQHAEVPGSGIQPAPQHDPNHSSDYAGSLAC